MLFNIYTVIRYTIWSETGKNKNQQDIIYNMIVYIFLHFLVQGIRKRQNNKLTLCYYYSLPIEIMNSNWKIYKSDPRDIYFHFYRLVYL